MPTYIMKLQKDHKDYYLEWSTIVDAPLSYGMSLEDFKIYYERKYGSDEMGYLQERLDRVDKYGTSSVDGFSVEELISCNRAGTNEGELTKQEIIKRFCYDMPTTHKHDFKNQPLKLKR